MAFFDRLKKAFNALQGKDVQIVEVKKDSELYTLVSEKINNIDLSQIEKLEKRLSNVEKVMNYTLVKLNDLIENQKAANDLMLNTATMIEEIYNVFGNNDLIETKTAETPGEKKINDKDFVSMTKIPKKDEMN